MSGPYWQRFSAVGADGGEVAGVSFRMPQMTREQFDDLVALVSALAGRPGVGFSIADAEHCGPDSWRYGEPLRELEKADG